MNQVAYFGGPAIYSATWDAAIFALIDFVTPRRQDSFFVVDTFRDRALPCRTGQEGPNILQAAWVYPDARGLSVPLATRDPRCRLIGSVSYRGQVLIGQKTGFGRLVDVAGVIPVPEPQALILAMGAFASWWAWYGTSVRRR